MKLFKQIYTVNTPTAVALGCFDGFHIGHRAVIGEMMKATKEGLVPAVFTFADYPQKGTSTRIYTHDEKIEELENLGVELTFCLPFSQISLFSAEDFVCDVLKNAMCAKKVYCGYNYKFGRGGHSDVNDLKYLCEKQGIEVIVLDEITLDGMTVSSSAIRSLLESGDIITANRMLTHPYALCGEVIHGNALGRKIGTPTINIQAEDTKLLPKYGVYASKVYCKDDNRVYRAALNIGIKPTFALDAPTVEAFLIDEINADFYGKRVKIELLAYLREERKFPTLEALQDAIYSDVKAIKEII